MPEFLTRIEGPLNELDLQREEIVVRMTGCPNGCARPYLAEIAFVGKAPNTYPLYLGGPASSTRLNRLFKDSVKTADLIHELRLVLRRYQAEKVAAERFGDFCARVLWNEAPAQPATSHK